MGGKRPPGYEVSFENGVADPTGVKEYYTEYYEEWEPEDDI